MRKNITVNWRNVRELDAAGVERFRIRLAHLEQAEPTPSQAEAFERNIAIVAERVRAAKDGAP